MSTTAEPPVRTPAAAPPAAAPAVATGVELLGEIHGSGYRDGACLVRRGDGQMVQVGPLLYALLDALDGRRDTRALARVMADGLGREVEPEHVDRLTEKAAALGLLAGTEDQAPPKVNPLLALRWKVLVTNPDVTRRLTRPFTVLFRPWLLWPLLAAFLGVCWFVLIHKGVASATAQAFADPELLLLVFTLAVASAGFHEMGHAAACRYGGGTPGGMGMGIYLVWPAFYTDVTDAYRLPKRARLRTDLGGLYFNAVVAVVTLGVWLAVRADALLLLIALQLVEMVKQLSPVIRADGYHILSDATGVPDLYAHIGPTLKGLLPWRRERSALTGRARALVSAWVLVVVPVLASMAISAVILLPRLAATAWESGRAIAGDLPGDGVFDVLTGVLQLLALALPVLGSVLIGHKLVRTAIDGARRWSAGDPLRRGVTVVAGVAVLAGAAWAWWPAGQYEPVRAGEDWTLAGVARQVSAPRNVAPLASERADAKAAPVRLEPGRHVAIAMVPVGGATKKHPALFVIKGRDGRPSVAVVSASSPDPAAAPTASDPSTAAPPPATAAEPSASASSATVPASAFEFELPTKPREGDSQALAVNTKDGSVLYDVAWSVVTVHDGQRVDNVNSAWAFANCKACTTVAVSFQVVLVVGKANVVTPVNAAGALNVDCPACLTTALARQIVVTLREEPSADLLARINASLARLDGLAQNGSTEDLVTAVYGVSHDIEAALVESGQLDAPSSSSTSAPPPATTTPTSTTPTSTTSTTPAAPPPTTTQTTPAEPTTTTETTPAQTTPTETTPAEPTTTTATTPAEPTTTTTP